MSNRTVSQVVCRGIVCATFLALLPRAEATEYTVTSGDFSVPADATKVTKEGSGTVTLSAVSSAANVTFDVKEGMLTVPDKTSRMGTGTPIVYVAEEAKLWCSNLSVANVGGNVQMKLYLGGTVQYSPYGSYAKAKQTYLTSDAATALVENKLSGMWETSHLLDMAGRTFNINGYGWRKGGWSGDVTGYLLRGNIKDNGDFNLGANAELIFNGDNVSYTGTKSIKTITMADKSEVLFCTKSKSAVAQTTANEPIPYGVVANGDVYVTAEDAGGTVYKKGANTLLGPMVINKGGTLTAYMRSNTSMLFADGVDGPGGFVKTGLGTLFVTGRVDCAVNALTLDRGTFVLEDGVVFSATNENSGVGFDVGAQGEYFNSIPRLWVGSNATYVVANSNNLLSLAWAANKYGIVDVVGGAMTNNFTIGGTGNGYVRVLGGDVCWKSVAQRYDKQQVAVNDGSYSALVITNGSVRSSTNGGILFGDGDSTVYVTERGEFRPNYSCSYKNGFHTLYVAGTLYNKYSFYPGQDIKVSTYDNEGGCVLTLDGENADFFANTFQLTTPSGFTGTYTAQVNLNRGIFHPANFARKTDPTGRNDRLYFTANGGTFKRTYAGEYIGGQTGYGADKFVVYPGGLTVETDMAASDKKVRIGTPIEAPTGKGVKSVTLPDAILALTNYPGPAKLTITMASGAGFTAVCEYEAISDPLNNVGYGRVKGVKVTCPGWGIENDGDVVVKVHYPHHESEPVEATVVLEDNAATGGLTKTGVGYLVLGSNANTYGGETYVKQGTLEVESGASLPPNARVRTAHDVNLALRSDQTLKSLEVEGYLWTAGPGKYTITDELIVDGAVLAKYPDRNILRGTTIEFAQGAKIVLKNADKITQKRAVFVPALQTLTVPGNSLPVVDENGQTIPTVHSYVRTESGGQALYILPNWGTVLFVQ